MKNIALVTGSSSGLGFEIAKCLTQKNHSVFLTGRSQDKLDAAVSHLPGQADHFCGDLTNHGHLERLFTVLLEKKLFPSTIIHSLGGKVEDDVQPLSVKVLQESMQLNLEVSVAINAYFLPKMVEKGIGRIVHVSSDASLSGQSAPGYAAAKAAVNAYVKSTARFYAKHNVMVCAVLPGIFEHEGSAWAEKKMSAPDHYQKKIKEMPLGRFAHPIEIASVIADIACSNSMMHAGALIPLTGAY